MPQKMNAIFELLSEQEFKNPDTGLLFFPVYIYTYSPKDEFEMRKEILKLDEKLKRPSNSLNSLLINLYHEFIEWLESQEVFGDTLLNEVFEAEKRDYQSNLSYLIDQANSDVFIQYIGQKIKHYFESQSSDKVYLLLSGIGEIYPYLRLSNFFKKTEGYVRNYKIIAFYPGEFENNKYLLFGMPNNENLYRVNHLNLILK